MDVFEVAQVPEKGFLSLPLCFGSVSPLHYIFPLLFCSACLLSLFSPHLSTLLQGSFFINMLISSPGMVLAAHCSPGRARGESQERERKGRERISKRSESVTYNRAGQGVLAKENLALTGVMMPGRRGLSTLWTGLVFLYCFDIFNFWSLILVGKKSPWKLKKSWTLFFPSSYFLAISKFSFPLHRIFF